MLPRLVAQFDEPFADASAIPTYLVSKFAAEHVTVVLSGDGGDELFGGYSSFFMTEQFRYADKLPRLFRKGLERMAAVLPPSAYGKNYLYAVSRPTSMERYLEYGCFGGHFRLSQILDAEWMIDSREAFIRQVFGPAVLPEGRDPLSQAMHFEATAKLAGDILDQGGQDVHGEFSGGALPVIGSRTGGGCRKNSQFLENTERARQADSPGGAG